MRQRPQVLPLGAGRGAEGAGLGGDAEPFIGGHEPCGVVAARGAGRVGARGADRPARHGPPLRRLRRLQALPRRLVAALRGGHHGLRRHRARRPRASTSRCRRARWCRCPTSCPSPRAPRSSCGTGTAYGALRRMHLAGGDDARGVRPGPGRPQRHAARRGDGRARHRGRDERRAAGAGEEVRRRARHRSARPTRAAIKELTNGEGVDLAWTAPACPRRALAAVRSARPGARCASSARAATSPSTSAATCCASSSPSSARGPSAPWASSSARASSPTTASTLDALFSHRWKLDQADEAYRVFDTQSTGKGVIVF